VYDHCIGVSCKAESAVAFLISQLVYMTIASMFCAKLTLRWSFYFTVGAYDHCIGVACKADRVAILLIS